jgi:hypothetical protein
MKACTQRAECCERASEFELTAMSAIQEPLSIDEPRTRDALAAPRTSMLDRSLVGAAVLGAGALECWFGRTDMGSVYGSDAVQYLDIARALEAGQWKLAMNPLWGLGYSLLLALLHPIFPAGPAGDLLSVRVLNLIIFAATGLSFWYLIRGLLPSGLASGGEGRRRILLVGAACIFCGTQICIDKVSRVGPDQLVACLYLLTCGMLVRMMRKGNASLAFLCGLTMGLGYVTKLAFLPLGCFVLLEMGIAVWRRLLRFRQLAICGAAFAAIVLLYASGMSSALGRPTLGEAGAINYAWNVNRLAKWVHWEGGTDLASKAWPKASVARFAKWTEQPPDFGKPIHPTPILGENPKIFAFGEPFAVTYPPYYDPPWWYEGYRHLFNWRYQVISAGFNLMQLAQVLFLHPMLYAAAIAILILAWGTGGEKVWQPWLREQWPLWVFALATVALFVPVHLEGRYFAQALAVLTIVPLTGLLASIPQFSGRKRNAILVIFLVGALLEVGVSERETLKRAAGRGDSEAAMQSKAAGLLANAGMTPNTRIGLISWEPSLHCDWAYIADLHVTGEIATAQDWKQFWALTPEMQRQVLERFRSTGATAVVAWYKPDSPGAPGWQQMGTLPLWLYRL